MKPLFMLLFLMMFFQGVSQEMSAQNIIDACIEKHGGKKYKQAHYSYDFRKHHYEFYYSNGQYRYERQTIDGKTIDILTNNEFTRKVDGKEVALKEKKKRAYSNSVNSVHYFAFLPSFLNDASVKKKRIGETTIKEKEYYKIEVTFDQEGGGDDHDDVYVYWINKEDYSMDYLAYSFHVNGGGVRFRSAYNQRIIGGITFQDYVNYKHNKNTPVADLDELFEQNKLTELSKIELTNIKEIKRN